jgi:hypothetical protein
MGHSLPCCHSGHLVPEIHLLLCHARHPLSGIHLIPSLPPVVVESPPVTPSCPTFSIGHPSNPVTPDVLYRESILAAFRMDPRLIPAGMTELQGEDDGKSWSFPTFFIGNPSCLYPRLVYATRNPVMRQSLPTGHANRDYVFQSIEASRRDSIS